MMGTLLQDLRFALRSLARRPALTFASMLSLGLGIGANSTIFTLVNAAFLQAIPVAAPDRVLVIYGTAENQPGLLPVSYANFTDLQQHNRVLSDLAAFHWVRLNMVRGDQAERLFGQIVSEKYFELLGVEPLAGRMFGPEDFRREGGHPVAVLTYRYWDFRFGGDRSILGKQVILNNREFTVVGIAPKGFKGANTQLNGPDIFVPMSMYRQLSQHAPQFEDRSFRMLDLIGRLAPGVTLEQGAAGLRSTMASLRQEHPDANRGQDLEVLPLPQALIVPQQRQAYLRAGTLLTLVAGLLLAIACANVASLLLTRGIERRREIAIRLSMGVQRGRLVRQLLTESLVLALLGGGLGLLIAAWGPGLLWRLRPPFLTATALDLSLDGRILAFTLATSLLTGLIFGLAPALQAYRSDLVPALRDQNAPLSRKGRRLPWRDLLIASQVALSLVSLIGAGLFLRSLRNAQAIDPGFNTTAVVNMRINLGAQGYGPQQGQNFLHNVLARVESIPGVRSATLSANLPLNRGAIYRRAVPEGDESPRAEDRPHVRTNTVGPRYFETLGIPIVRGRGFSDLDREGAPLVAVVNETLARQLWPGRDAVGRRFRTPEEDNLRYEVIGVARDSKYVTLSEPPEPLFYLFHRQSYAPEVLLHTRTEGSPHALLETVRREVQALDRALPLADVQTMGDVLASSLWAPRMGATLLSVVAALALALAATGIYGVMAYSVNQRQREVGIRMALGARGADVLRLILGRAMVVIGGGLALGIVCAVAGARFLSNLLYGIAATDLRTLASITAFLLVVAVCASYLAARRSTRVSPVITLRGG